MNGAGGTPLVLGTRPVRVLVTDAGRGSAVSVIRSLGRRGAYVMAADADPRSAGFHSRYTARRLVYPSPSVDAAAAADRIARAAEVEGVDLIVPVTDEAILPLVAIRDRIERSTRLALPETSALVMAADKAETIALAQRLGIPVPATRVVRDVEEALHVAGDLGWPVVVKPARSRTYGPSGRILAHRVGYADGPDELVRAMAALEGAQALIQEFWPGIGVGIELLLADGRPVAAFQHRRIREVPLTGGASAFRVSVPLDPNLYRQSVALLGALGWTGLAMVEYRSGPDGARLMEVNGRIWGSLPLAVQAGVDFPALMACVHLHGRPTGCDCRFAGDPVERAAERRATDRRATEPRATDLDGRGVRPAEGRVAVADPAPPAPAGAASRPAPIPAIGYRVGVRSRNLPLEVSWISSVLVGGPRRPYLPVPPRRQAIAAALGLLRASDGYDVLSRDDPMPGLAEIVRIAGDVLARVRHGR